MPKTPARPSAQASTNTPGPVISDHAAGTLQTPWTSKLSSRSPDVQITQVDQLTKWVIRDIDDGDRAETLLMIKALLSLVSRNVEYNQCLEAVANIANVAELRGYIEAYCAPIDEKDRYGPFTQLCNKAWELLLDVEIEGLPRPTALGLDRLIFQRNDNLSPNSNHASLTGVSYDLVPDVALWSRCTADKLNSERGTDEANAPHNISQPSSTAPLVDYTRYTQKPKWTSEWYQWSLCCEFKKKKQPRSYPRAQRYEICKDIKPPESGKSGESLYLQVGLQGNQMDSNQTSEVATGEGDEVAENHEYVIKQGDLKKRARTSVSQSGNKSAKSNQHSSPHAGGLQEIRLTRDQNTIIQCARYAIEQLTSSLRRTHVINLLFEDEILWIMWFDRRGFIQSQGFDFILNFPHFLALFLILQRFTPTEWGFSRGFVSNSHANTPPSSTLYGLSWVHHPQDFFVDIPIYGFGELNGKMVRCKIEPHGDDSHIKFALGGRATRVQECKLVQIPGRDDSNVQAFIENAGETVIKIYWTQDTRKREEEIICLATELGQNDERVKGHLPIVYCACGVDDSSTDKIRRRLNFEDAALRGTRSLRLIVFKKLKPLTSLTGMAFWKAFWQCFSCNYVLHAYGIDHSDISPGNLMYDNRTGKGVLNDFDLAHVNPQFPGDKRTIVENEERTGTLPFMALDLLTEDGYLGRVPRLYRHSAEAFTWTLLWICGRYMNGKHDPPLQRGGKGDSPKGMKQFDGWLSPSYSACRSVKKDIAEALKFLTVPDPQFQQFTVVTRRMILHWKRLHENAEAELLMLDDEIPEPPPAPQESRMEVVTEFIESVKSGFSPDADSKEGFQVVLEAMGNLNVVVPR